MFVATRLDVRCSLQSVGYKKNIKYARLGLGFPFYSILLLHYDTKNHRLHVELINYEGTDVLNLEISEINKLPGR